MTFRFGQAGDAFVVGDWDGDGDSDPGAVRPDGSGSLTWSLDTSGDLAFGAGDATWTFGSPGDQPVAGAW